MSISIHAAREGGDDGEEHEVTVDGISIHAAREGGDQPFPTAAVPYRKFQSTPPVKAATMQEVFRKVHYKFQSTPPVKAATLQHCSVFAYRGHFNPRRP